MGELNSGMMVRGGGYNWKHSPQDRLIYLGKSGAWHQFHKVGDPREVWCEVLDTELHMLEQTKENHNV
jgi:hypothetical protein